MIGQRVYTSTISIPVAGEITAPVLISMPTEPSGIYLYRVIKDDGTLIGSGKIVIQK
jgi:hypothetical protein